MNNQKLLIKTLGQYLYQNINQPWLSAKIILEYTQHNSYAHSESICSASFIPGDIKESTIQHIQTIPVTPAITANFALLFQDGVQQSNRSWRRAIFSIKPNGDYALNFEMDEADINH